MKWVLLAILLVIVPYTFITLRYRKPGPAFQPYEDMKNRANTSRLLSAGFQRVALTAARPATPTPALFNATISPAPGGLPGALRTTLVEPPPLPADIASVAGAPSVDAGAALYVRQAEIFIAPEFEKISGGLLSRTRESTVQLAVPAGLLKPGNYRLTLLGAQSSRAWTVRVQ